MEQDELVGIGQKVFGALFVDDTLLTI